MKNKLFLGLLVVGFVIAAFASQSTSLYILNPPDTEVPLRVRAPATKTTPFLEFIKGGTNVMTISADGAFSGGTAATLNSLGAPAGTNGFLSGVTLIGSTTNAALTASLPVWTDANKVQVSKTVATAKTGLGIQSGSATMTGGTATITFGTAFASAPVVVGTPADATTPLSVGTISASGCVFTGTSGAIVYWVAVGAP